MKNDQAKKDAPKKEIHLNSFTRFLFSLITLFIMLGALPVGVYLVGQKTSFLPEATTKAPSATGETSFTVEESPKMSENGKLAVNILARSDQNHANLFAARLFYPKDSLEITSIATSSATLPAGVSLDNDIKTEFLANKWLQSSNEITDQGEVTLIGGLSNPGIQTDPDTKYVLATIFFNVKNSGQVTLHFDPGSSIFNNDDNSILATRENDASFDVISSPAPAASPKPRLPAPRSKFQPSKFQPWLTLASPIGGESVVYNQPLDIKWTSNGVGQVTVSLLLNDQVLGGVASASASLGKLSLKPSDYILPTFLTSTNSFKVKISDPESGISDTSRGPFAIVSTDNYPQDATQAASLASRGGDANNDGSIDLFDVSKLLSSYGTAKDSNFGLDLNGDQAVNDVDFYLLRNLMLKKGLIQ